MISLEASDNEETIQMIELENTTFDAAAFLGKAGLGRRIMKLKPKEAFFRKVVLLTRFSICKKDAQESP